MCDATSLPYFTRKKWAFGCSCKRLAPNADIYQLVFPVIGNDTQQLVLPVAGNDTQQLVLPFAGKDTQQLLSCLSLAKTLNSFCLACHWQRKKMQCVVMSSAEGW